MKIIPSNIINTESDAEKKVHCYLSEISISNVDLALHSLNLGKHEYKKWGEADFIIVSRRGILLVEVKGGGIACEDGVWEFTNRFGETTRKSEGPATQAKSAFYALKKNYLDPHFKGELARVPMGWAVVFTDIDRLVSEGVSGLPEQPDEITAYRPSLRGAKPFKVFLGSVFDYWEGKVHGQPRELEAGLVGRVARLLRPNFERFPGLNSQLTGIRDELFELTKEQYQRLEDIEDNERIMIRGGAGTGKTFLAVAAARYEASAGKHVLIVTRSPFLATFIESHGLPEKVSVVPVEQLLEGSGGGKKWDVLIVDEGQDLCQWDTLAALDEVIDGGLEQGKWRWFGDPNNQVSPSYPIDLEVLAYLGGLCFKQKLSQNIRNTPPIVKAIQDYAAADVGIPRPIGQGGDVEFIDGETLDEQVGHALATVRRWIRKEEVSPSDIAILFGDECAIPELVKMAREQGIRVEGLSEKTCRQGARNAVVVSSIEQFKGLERPVVFLAGLGSTEELSELRGTLYRGFSRANHTLVVSCSLESRAKLLELCLTSQSEL